jgi:hypothetical protein
LNICGEQKRDGIKNMRNFIAGLLLSLISTVGWCSSSGTGFFVSSQGHIVTNEHVVENCSAIDFSFGGQKHNALVLAVDKTNDIALLKTTFDNPQFLSFASSDPELLDPIIVAGYPFGDSLSSTIKVTRGVVSSLAGIGNNFSNVQIDAAIQPGNSGGPIVNEQGQVLAIAVSKLNAEYALKTFGSLPESVNFGVKGGVVKSFLRANGVSVSESSLDTGKLGQILSEATVKLTCSATLSIANERMPEPTKRERSNKGSTQERVTLWSEGASGVIDQEQWSKVKNGMILLDVKWILGDTPAQWFYAEPERKAFTYCSSHRGKTTNWVWLHHIFLEYSIVIHKKTELLQNREYCDRKAMLVAHREADSYWSNRRY